MLKTNIREISTDIEVADDAVVRFRFKVSTTAKVKLQPYIDKLLEFLAEVEDSPQISIDFTEDKADEDQ